MESACIIRWSIRDLCLVKYQLCMYVPATYVCPSYVCVCACVRACVCACVRACMRVCVTGFAKTSHVHTKIEIHFIAQDYGYTQEVSMHSVSTAQCQQVERIFLIL